MSDILKGVHAYAAAINAMDPEAFAALFAREAEIHDPVGAPPWKGPDGAREFLGQFVPVTETVYLRAGKIEVNGNHAAFTWAVEATGKNGQFAAADGIDVLVFDINGKIVRASGYWNPGPFVAALLAGS